MSAEDAMKLSNDKCLSLLGFTSMDNIREIELYMYVHMYSTVLVDTCSSLSCKLTILNDFNL